MGGVVWRCNPRLTNCSHLFVLNTCLLHVSCETFLSSTYSFNFSGTRVLHRPKKPNHFQNADPFRPSIEFQGTTNMSVYYLMKDI